MENLTNILEAIMLKGQDEIDPNLSIIELQTCLYSIDEIIEYGVSLKESIICIMLEKYKKILFEDEKYYNIIYLSKFESNKNTFKRDLIQQKIGGWPTFKRGEKWPLTIDGDHMTFIAQFKSPINNFDILYRIFANIDDQMNNYYKLMPLEIKDTNKYIKNIKLAHPNGKIIEEYIIEEWSQIKELKSFAELSDNVPEYIYDKIINSKEQNEGIKISDCIIIDEKKLVFQVNANFIMKPNDGNIYYFYEDEYMQCI